MYLVVRLRLLESINFTAIRLIVSQSVLITIILRIHHVAITSGFNQDLKYAESVVFYYNFGTMQATIVKSFQGYYIRYV